MFLLSDCLFFYYWQHSITVFIQLTLPQPQVPLFIAFLCKYVWSTLCYLLFEKRVTNNVGFDRLIIARSGQLADWSHCPFRQRQNVTRSIFSTHSFIFQTYASVPQWWVKITPHERYLISLQVISHRTKKTKFRIKDGFLPRRGTKRGILIIKEESKRKPPFISPILSVIHHSVSPLKTCFKVTESPVHYPSSTLIKENRSFSHFIHFATPNRSHFWRHQADTSRWEDEMGK